MGKGEETRERIVSEASRQGSVRGVAAVSLADVADAVGLSKSAVFKHFQSKDALQMAVLESIVARFSESVWQPAEALPPGRPRLESIFERWLDWVDGESTNTAGCGLMTAQIEFDDQPGPFRDYLKGQQVRWHRTLSHEFAALRDPPLAREEADLAAFEMKSVALGYNHSRRLLDDETARRVARRSFEALVERTAGAA
jgi:AcrR family transcriptional regulator